MSKNEYSISPFSNLQIRNYFQAENIIIEAFKEYKDYISKIELKNNEIFEISMKLIFQFGKVD